MQTGPLEEKKKKWVDAPGLTSMHTCQSDAGDGTGMERKGRPGKAGPGRSKEIDAGRRRVLVKFLWHAKEASGTRPVS